MTRSPSPFAGLYGYTRWANRRVCDAAAALPPEALTLDQGTSYPTVWDTLRHIAWAEWRWLGRWLGQAPGTSPPLWRLPPWRRSWWWRSSSSRAVRLQPSGEKQAIEGSV